MNNGLTDELFALVVKGVINDYHFLAQQGDTHEIISAKISARLRATSISYTAANGSAVESQLQRISQCLLPHLQEQARQQQGWFVKSKANLDSEWNIHEKSTPPHVTYVFVESNAYGYDPTADLSFNLLLLQAMSHHHHHCHHSLMGCGLLSGISGGCGDSKDGPKVLAILALITLAAAAVFSALLATVYLINHFLATAERLWFNEGVLRAILLMGATLGAGLLTAALTPVILVYPITMLTVMAGFASPVGWIVLATVCLGLVGAAIGCFATNRILNHYETKNHPHAIDPVNAHRFKLTDAEAAKLERKGIDPVATKIAIVLLNSQLQTQLNSGASKHEDKRIPGFFTRHFTSDGLDVNAILAKVRDLRQGKLDTVEISGLRINCKQPSSPMYPSYNPGSTQYAYSHQSTI